ncbi:diacylglycerol/lipid kinase family protein [Telluribacter humicola]|uniref:diacylglycerol/lipid kinase family protein n=1 Tax=Telluribacter humicola TaxID=1720261 RepID=UPI001A9592D8|nr:diacylglycerol kinase family protein [Telluribacter humicola]
MAKPSYLFVLNPRSGTRLGQSAADIAAYIESRVRKEGHTARTVTTQYRGHATELVRESIKADEWSAVVAVGGDGTVNEVGRALLHTSTPMGILPLGSGNGLARHLALPLELPSALDRVLHGRPLTIDSAQLNGNPFFCVAGLGFDAHVSHLFSQYSRRGLEAYLRVSWGAYWNYQPQTYQLNGQPLQAFSLSFANAGQFGNNAWVAPQADLTDGVLDQCTVTPFPKWYGTALVYRLFSKGMKGSAYVNYEPVTGAVVETEGPALVHYDGEPYQLDTNRVEVQIVPKSLRVVC